MDLISRQRFVLAGMLVLFMSSSCKTAANSGANVKEFEQLGNSYNFPHYRIGFNNGSKWLCLSAATRNPLNTEDYQMELSFKDCNDLSDRADGAVARWNTPATEAWFYYPQDIPKTIMMDFERRSMSIGKSVPEAVDPRTVQPALVKNNDAIEFDSLSGEGKARLFYSMRNMCLGAACVGEKQDGSQCGGDYKLTSHFIRIPNVSAQNPEEAKRHAEYVNRVCTEFTFLKIKQIIH